MVTTFRAGLVLVFLVVLISGFGTRRGELIDINHAGIGELKSLPGIRDAYAAAIVRNRPYKNKAQLLSKQVIPEAVYEKIRARIIARQ